MDNEKLEVLRYLGYNDQQISPELDSMITECMLQMLEIVSPRLARKTFGIKFIPGGILLENTGILLRGNDIRKHLDGCTQVVLFAATLGVQADNLIRQYESTDLTRSLVLDACATQYIEQYCDRIEEYICREASQNGLAAVGRFSPGYGDLPLDVQPRFLVLLDAVKKIGLTCSDSFIMLPRKSVTALIGLGKNLKTAHVSCSDCSINAACAFRKEK